MAEFSDTVCNALQMAARDKVGPVMRDAVTWLLHECGLNFTDDERMSMHAGLLTACINDFLILTAIATSKCKCHDCLDKRFNEVSDIFFDGLEASMAAGRAIEISSDKEAKSS